MYFSGIIQAPHIHLWSNINKSIIQSKTKVMSRSRCFSYKPLKITTQSILKFITTHQTINSPSKQSRSVVGEQTITLRLSPIISRTRRKSLHSRPYTFLIRRRHLLLVFCRVYLADLFWSRLHIVPFVDLYNNFGIRLLIVRKYVCKF